MEKHTLKNIDIALLKRLKEGDEAAFESIYWKYNSHVFILLTHYYTIGSYLKILPKVFS